MRVGAFALLLLPFVAFDVALYLLRRRGDRSAARRAEILRYFTEEEIQTGRAHLLRHNRLFPARRALYYLAFCALLAGELAAGLERLLLGWVGGSWALALPLFLLALLAGWVLLHLPLEAYAELVVEREAGLSTTSARLWLLDQLKGLGVAWALGLLVAYPVLALVRGLPRAWPLPAAAALVGISAFTIWISPWVIAPLFNRFWPLSDEGLLGRVRALVERAGLDARRVLVADASRRDTRLNAYFTGLGSSRRVVLYDTLLEACPPGEVLSVVAHELGHWKRRHIAKLFLVQSAGMIVGLVLLERLLASPALRALLGLPAPSSLALLVALPFLASLASRIAAPPGAALSRRFERQADRIALELTADPAAFVSLEQRLVRRAKSDLLQNRLVHLWYGSHPLPEERIRSAEAWRGPAG